MPLIALAIALLAVLLAAIALMPLTLVQRYRVGTARRLARGWITTLNLIAIGISIVLFLAGSGRHEHLGAASVSVRARRPGAWDAGRRPRTGVDQVGREPELASLHAEPLARARNHADGDVPAALRILARLADVASGTWTIVLARRVGRRRIACRRRGRARVLLHVLDRRPPPLARTQSHGAARSTRPSRASDLVAQHRDEIQSLRFTRYDAARRPGARSRSSVVRCR